jgi:hypothetical protein
VIDPRVDDRAPGLHVANGRARHVEIAEDVRAERAIELLVREILDAFLMLLKCGIVHENVQSSELVDDALHRSVTER